MKTTLETVNRMKSDGVIGKYAIGGAVGATLYLEPAATLDVDIFVELPAVPEAFLVSLAPIYNYLTRLGCKIEAEHIVIGDWPVQFLSCANALEKEAVHQALEIRVEGVNSWVISAEHLAAIAPRTGRAKDKARLVQFVEQDALDHHKLEGILTRHGLVSNGKLSSKDTSRKPVSKESRKRLAALSFTEKIKILEKLRDRSLALAAAGLRKKKRVPARRTE
jgi:hypothetical protein